MKPSSPLPLSEIILGLFKKKGSLFSDAYFLFRLSQQWKELAGEEISKCAEPVQFKNQALVLALPDSSHLQEIHFFKEILRKKINRRFPDKNIQKIILKSRLQR